MAENYRYRQCLWWRQAALASQPGVREALLETAVGRFCRAQERKVFRISKRTGVEFGALVRKNGI